MSLFFIFFASKVERLAEKERSLKAKRGWFGFLWSSTQAEETQELNSAAAISNNLDFCLSLFIFVISNIYFSEEI